MPNHQPPVISASVVLGDKQLELLFGEDSLPHFFALRHRKAVEHGIRHESTICRLPSCNLDLSYAVSIRYRCGSNLHTVSVTLTGNV